MVSGNYQQDTIGVIDYHHEMFPHMHKLDKIEFNRTRTETGARGSLGANIFGEVKEFAVFVTHDQVLIAVAVHIGKGRLSTTEPCPNIDPIKGINNPFLSAP